MVVGMALAALAGGAVGVRIEGLANVRAVRQATEAPIIGLTKRDRTDTPIRITPIRDDALALIEAGADIVAFDATGRARPTPVSDMVEAFRGKGALAMADCATLADGVAALAAGADLVGSTLSGYTDGPEPDQPDLELVARLRELTPHVVAEGRIRYPEQAAAALDAGAFAVVVGSAITRPEHITAWFAAAIDGAAGR